MNQTLPLAVAGSPDPVTFPTRNGSPTSAYLPNTPDHAKLNASVMPSTRCKSCGKPRAHAAYAAHPDYCDLICWNTRADTLDKTVSRRWPKPFRKTFLEQHGDKDAVQLHRKLKEDFRHKISNLCRTHLGLKLEQQRLRHNLTLVDWQRQCNINQEPYQKILQGERNVTDKTLEKALDACEIENTNERSHLMEDYRAGKGTL